MVSFFLFLINYYYTTVRGFNEALHILSTLILRIPTILNNKDRGKSSSINRRSTVFQALKIYYLIAFNLKIKETM